MSKALPLLFIDTNIFLDFYRSQGEAGMSLLKRINDLHEHLITTDQVEMEFLKNRQRVISSTIQLLKTTSEPKPPVIPAYLSESSAAICIDKNLKNIRKQVATLRDRFQKMLQKPNVHDPVFKVVNTLATNSSPLNLRSNRPQQAAVVKAAHERFLRGYPPRKSEDTSMGDAINWEWILICARESQRNVIIVSRDGDYGLRLDSKHYVNDWLQHEFKTRTARAYGVDYTSVLSCALKQLDVKVTSAEELEEQKIIARSERPPVNLDALWTSLVEAVGRASPFIRTYLLEARPVSLRNGLLIIGFPPELQDHIGLVDNSRNHTLLQTKLVELGYDGIKIKYTALEDTITTS